MFFSEVFFKSIEPALGKDFSRIELLSYKSATQQKLHSSNTADYLNLIML